MFDFCSVCVTPEICRTHRRCDLPSAEIVDLGAYREDRIKKAVLAGANRYLARRGEPLLEMGTTGDLLCDLREANAHDRSATDAPSPNECVDP